MTTEYLLHINGSDYQLADVRDDTSRDTLVRRLHGAWDNLGTQTVTLRSPGGDTAEFFVNMRKVVAMTVFTRRT